MKYKNPNIVGKFRIIIQLFFVFVFFILLYVFSVMGIVAFEAFLGSVEAQKIMGAKAEKGIEIFNKGADYWYTKAAESGDVEAQLILGKYYIEKDANLSSHWLKKSADNGNIEAAYLYGIGTYYKDRFFDGCEDSIKDINYVSKAAEQGNVEAIYYLGLMHECGHLFERSDIIAASYYQKLSQSDYIPGLYKLGQCYLKGRGVEQSFISAEKVLKKAHNLDVYDEKVILALGKALEGQSKYTEAADIYMKYIVSSILSPRMTTGLFCLEIPVDQTIISALANLYAEGKGVTKSLKISSYMHYRGVCDTSEERGLNDISEDGFQNSFSDDLGVLIKYADKGDPFYQSYLGLLFLRAYMNKEINEKVNYAYRNSSLSVIYGQRLTIEKCKNIALSLFKTSAKQGCESGCLLLSQYYIKGIDTAPSYYEAYKVLNEISDSIDPDIQYHLGLCCLHLHNYKEAVRHFKISASSKHRTAEYKLGLCYLTGTGVKQSIDKAEKYFSKSLDDTYYVSTHEFIFGEDPTLEGELENIKLLTLLGKIAGSKYEKPGKSNMYYDDWGGSYDKCVEEYDGYNRDMVEYFMYNCSEESVAYRKEYGHYKNFDGGKESKMANKVLEPFCK